MRPGADYKAQQLKEIVGYLGEHFTEPLWLSAVAAEFGLSPLYFSTFFGDNFGKDLHPAYQFPANRAGGASAP